MNLDNYSIQEESIYSINDVSSTEYTEFLNSDHKYCSVCGDKALGYNFGAMTCESCKAFFRRNAYKNVLSCVFNKNCEITVNTRRFCSDCRLKKCLAMKMKKEKILVKSKIRSNEFSANHQRTKITKPNIEDRQYPTFHTEEPNIISKEPSKYNNSVSCGTCSTDPTVIMSITKSIKLISINDKLTREGQARLLTEGEWSILASLHQAYVNNFINNSESMPTDQINKANLSSLVNSSGFIVRRFINFAKKIQEFAALDQPSQIVLLKGSVLYSIILRSVIEFDVSKQSWVTPKGEISSDVIKAAGLFQLHDDYSTYSKSFKHLMGSDDYLIILTQVLCLFSSDHQGLTNRQDISDIHDKYLILLKHYLEAKHGFVGSKCVLISLLSNMRELQDLTTKHGQILLHVDPTDVDPLMIEVFNMSINNYFKN